jgi:hypothetical protein
VKAGAARSEPWPLVGGAVPWSDAGMHTATARGLAAVLFSFSLLAQDAGNGLQVKADPNCVVANGLPGVWLPDAALAQRLGGKAAADRLEFRTDATVLAKIPAAIAGKLKDQTILLAGMMKKGESEHVFLLTVLSGNPTVVWFRERAGDPCGDAESWNVMFVRAGAKPADLLFVGGDHDNQAFAGYARADKPKGELQPEAAMNEILALISSGRGKQFVETYCAPADLSKILEGGRTIESLADRFNGERGKELAAALTVAAKQAPTLSADGNTATWQLDASGGLPKTFRLQRIDGRWYLVNR